MFLGCTPKPSPVYTAGLGLTPPYGPEPGSMNAVTQPVYFANMVLLDRRPAIVADSGGPGWKQPCLRPRLEIPPCRSSAGGWKTRFISPRQGGILLPIPARGRLVHAVIDDNHPAGAFRMFHKRVFLEQPQPGSESRMAGPPAPTPWKRGCSGEAVGYSVLGSNGVPEQRRCGSCEPPARPRFRQRQASQVSGSDAGTGGIWQIRHVTRLASRRDEPGFPPWNLVGKRRQPGWRRL